MVFSRWIVVITCLAAVANAFSPSNRQLWENDLDVEELPGLSDAVWEPEYLEATERLSLERKKTLAISFVRKQLQTYGIPGIGLAVVAQNKTVIAQGIGLKEFGNKNNVMTGSTQFQLASFTKTFIALGISKLVDEKRVAWNDPVKRHLPGWSLKDKYAEKYTTIRDLLTMQSVFGDHETDFAWQSSAIKSDQELLSKLPDFETTREFRASYAYSNLNYEILGLVIESVTNQTWYAYLNQTILQPLGMKSTVGRLADANPQQLSYGHNFCDNRTIGPFNLRNETNPVFEFNSGLRAAGSLVSTPEDLAKFTHFLLNKGQGIFSSSSIVSEMTTGQSIHAFPSQYLPFFGYSYSPEGNAITAGYGFDFVGDLVYGNHVIDKGGDLLTFKSRNGFALSKGVGVVLLANAQSRGGKSSGGFLLDLLRTYVLGLFLDVSPKALERDFQLAIEALNKRPASPCDAHYFDGKPWDIPGVTIPKELKAKLVGEYLTAESPKFYGKAKVFLDKSDDVILEYGLFTSRLIATPDPNTFLWPLDSWRVAVPVPLLQLDDGKVALFVMGLNFVHV